MDALADRAVQDLLSAVIGLVSNWNAVSTQGSVAAAVGVDVPAGDVRALYTVGLRGGSDSPRSPRRRDSNRPARPRARSSPRLEALGLVARERGAGDGRAVQVALHCGRARRLRAVSPPARPWSARPWPTRRPRRSIWSPRHRESSRGFRDETRVTDSHSGKPRMGATPSATRARWLRGETRWLAHTLLRARHRVSGRNHSEDAAGSRRPGDRH